MVRSDLILASGSSARATLLRSAGVEFEVMPSRLDEAALRAELKASGASLSEMALMLATEKAMTVSAIRPDALVIGADQMLETKNGRLDKAADLDELRQQLKALRGQSHQLLSAMAVLRRGESLFTHVGIATLHMRNFTDAFLETYLKDMGAAALDLVGGYAIEGQGIQLFDEIEGEHSVILGLPLLPLLEFLRRADMMPP